MTPWQLGVGVAAAGGVATLTLYALHRFARWLRRDEEVDARDVGLALLDASNA